jgi:ABC-2 type transport system permease protein
MAGVGFAVGFRVHTSAAGFLAGLGLVTLFGYALSWGFVSLGCGSATPKPPRQLACR